jgi:uncharacterized protein (UPF0335 family)
LAVPGGLCVSPAGYKEVYAEAKGSGFEPKIMRQITFHRFLLKDLAAPPDA